MTRTTPRTRFVPPWTHWRLTGYALSTLALASCVMVGPDFKIPTARIQDRWLVLDDAPTAAPVSPDLRHWWERLHDPALDQLIALGIQNSPSLWVAGERVTQAEAQLKQAKGNLFPQQQTLSGRALRQHQSQNSSSYLPDFTPLNLNTHTAGLDIGWELDFWGKYRRAIESQHAGLEGNQWGYRAALISLTAGIANLYVSIRTNQAQLQVAQDNIGLQKESEKIARARFEIGENSERDWRQASSQLKETEAQIHTLQITLRQTKNALATLLGLTPSEIDAKLAPDRGIPKIDTQIAIGIPRDMLRQRPDVREAEQLAAAQSAQIGVAKAQLYPSFSLGGFFGYTASDVRASSTSDLFKWDSRTMQVGPSVSFPIFNYGRLSAQVEIQQSLFRQAVINYQNTVLKAQQEVEDARAALSGWSKNAEQLEGAAGDARRGTELALAQYREGATDYTTVLNAQQFQLRIENELVTARGAIPQATIALYKSLGGGWGDSTSHATSSISHPPKPEPGSAP